MYFSDKVILSNPDSENKQFTIKVDNVTKIIINFKNETEAEATIILNNVVQQIMPLEKIKY